MRACQLTRPLEDDCRNVGVYAYVHVYVDITMYTSRIVTKTLWTEASTSVREAVAPCYEPIHQVRRLRDRGEEAPYLKLLSRRLQGKISLFLSTGAGICGSGVVDPSNPG
jgi:hypothetical protein